MHACVCSELKQWLRRIVILEYKPEKNVFDVVHKETFGKSGSKSQLKSQQHLA